jgi:hypothetical protein
MAVSNQMKKAIVTDAKLWRCHLGGEGGMAWAPTRQTTIELAP